MKIFFLELSKLLFGVQTLFSRLSLFLILLVKVVGPYVLKVENVFSQGVLPLIV